MLLAITFFAQPWAQPWGGGSASSVPDAILRAVHPHSNTSYCEGLVFDDERGILVESSGNYGTSSLSILNLMTGEVLSRVDLPNSTFGEGATLLHGGSVAVQLTYEARTAYFYNISGVKLLQSSFKPFTTRTGQGWGLTSNRTHLIGSDGSALLYIWDAATLRLVQTLPLWYHDASVARPTPLPMVNELEWLRRREGGGAPCVLANLFYPEYYLVWSINLATGEGRVALNVTAAAAIAGADAFDYDHVFNGIALDGRDPGNESLLLTGKFWAQLLVVDAAPLYAVWR